MRVLFQIEVRKGDDRIRVNVWVRELFGYLDEVVQEEGIVDYVYEYI